LIATSYTVKRYEELAKLLESLQNQTYRNVEAIIVVDESAELFARLKSAAQEMTSVPVKVMMNLTTPGAAEGRNNGIRAAKGQILAFVDDDVVLTPGWAEEIDRVLSAREDVIGVTGSVLPLWASTDHQWVPKELYWLFSCTECLELDGLTEVRHGWGVNMAFKREAFETCGEFDTMTGPLRGGDVGIAEDLEFSLRVRGLTGKKILYDPLMQLYHKVGIQRLGWRFMFERSFIIGYSRRSMKRVQYAEKEKNLLSREKNLLARTVGRLIPGVLAELPRSRANAGKRFYMTALVLFSLALGYLYSYISASSGTLLRSRIGFR
jgi:glucosyl-dolichyl phosphate glucuronosyltransferase